MVALVKLAALAIQQQQHGVDGGLQVATESDARGSSLCFCACCCASRCAVYDSTSWVVAVGDCFPKQV